MAPARVTLVAAIAAAAAAATLTLATAATTAASAAAAVSRAEATAAAAPYIYRPKCPPYTTCDTDADCRSGLYGKRRVCKIQRCTPSWCRIDPVTCAVTRACSKDCNVNVHGACVDAPVPTPACPPYQVCGPGERPCGLGRRCRLQECTSPWCTVDPVTCKLGACQELCLKGKGYCVSKGAPTPTPTPTRGACPPYTVCGRGKPPCGAGRRCLRSACTSSVCQLDPVTCRIKGVCTADCQMERGYCVFD